MKWEGNRESDNVEDRRDSGGGGGGFGGGRSVGLGTIVVACIAGWVFGINPMTVLGLLSGGESPAPQSQQAPAHAPPADDHMANFVRTVLASTEDTWRDVFTQGGGHYVDPKLVLFRGQTPTGCGTGQTAMGPFYCPADQKVYIDLNFYQTLKTKLGSPGEFAEAYVVAHEVGHHVQKLLGISDKMDAMRSRMSETEYNAMSVRLELQADCFAGIWGNKAKSKMLENGDIESAMNAAAHIGDDALQKQSQGYVVPESFTHGTSAQRVRWFNIGIQNGNVKMCDTFSSRQL